MFFIKIWSFSHIYRDFFFLQQRREEYERHIRELEDELLQRETEQREMQLLMAEEEEVRREEEGGRERRRSTLLHPSASPAKFDYSPYHDSNTFTFTEFTDREVSTHLLVCYVCVVFYVVCRVT